MGMALLMCITCVGIVFTVAFFLAEIDNRKFKKQVELAKFQEKYYKDESDRRLQCYSDQSRANVELNRKLEKLNTTREENREIYNAQKKELSRAEMQITTISNQLKQRKHDLGVVRNNLQVALQERKKLEEKLELTQQKAETRLKTVRQNLLKARNGRSEATARLVVVTEKLDNAKSNRSQTVSNLTDRLKAANKRTEEVNLQSQNFQDLAASRYNAILGMKNVAENLIKSADDYIDRSDKEHRENQKE